MANSTLTPVLGEVLKFGMSLHTNAVGADYLRSEERQRFNKFAAYVLEAASAPVVAAARLAVWMEDGGPTLVRLPRIGRDDEPFYQVKIRTMAKGTEKQTHVPRQKDENDPRITRVGERLRRSSVDELPQFGNVRRGEMVMVGPRPLPLAEHAWLLATRDQMIDDAVMEGRIPEVGHDDTYVMCEPGLTGIEQVSGRGHLTPRERVESHDLYARIASLAVDLDIIRSTPAAVFTGHGAF